MADAAPRCSCSWCGQRPGTEEDTAPSPLSPEWYWITAMPMRPETGTVRLYLCCPWCAWELLDLGTPLLEGSPATPHQETSDG